jgi:predicted nucleotidyltransferase
MFEQTTSLDYLPEIKRRILSVSNPEKIILFGSFARGENKEDSDLDLLIIIKDVTSTRAESIRLQRSLRGLLVPVDIIVATPDQIKKHQNTNGYIYRSALAEGKVIYDQRRPK